MGGCNVVARKGMFLVGCSLVPRLSVGGYEARLAVVHGYEVSFIPTECFR